MDVTRLVFAAREGDATAFGQLVARYRPTAVLVAVAACGDREVAEDAVQDAFLTAHRALRNLDEPAHFGPWLAAIVRNRARRLAGDKERVRSMPLHLVEEVGAHPPPLPCPEAEAIANLPEGIRESMDLYYLQEWSVGEVAALLERPVTTVKWQLHAGRALLRKRFEIQETP